MTEDYNDQYWEQHYTIERERIPMFLERAAEKILRAGKYLNVIRQCGMTLDCPHATEIVYCLNERDYVERIEKAYDYASHTLLDQLLTEKKLMYRLRSIKHYFLLDQGDFFVGFMDLAEDELKKNMDGMIFSLLISVCFFINFINLNIFLVLCYHFLFFIIDLKSNLQGKGYTHYTPPFVGELFFSIEFFPIRYLP